jgi:hypothetical protein
MARAGKNDELSMPDLANTFHHAPKLYLKNPKNLDSKDFDGNTSFNFSKIRKQQETNHKGGQDYGLKEFVCF